MQLTLLTTLFLAFSGSFASSVCSDRIHGESRFVKADNGLTITMTSFTCAEASIKRDTPSPIHNNLTKRSAAQCTTTPCFCGLTCANTTCFPPPSGDVIGRTDCTALAGALITSTQTAIVPALSGEVVSFQTCSYFIFNNLPKQSAQICLSDMGTTALNTLQATCGTTSQALCFGPGNEFILEQLFN